MCLHIGGVQVGVTPQGEKAQGRFNHIMVRDLICIHRSIHVCVCVCVFVCMCKIQEVTRESNKVFLYVNACRKVCMYVWKKVQMSFF
jgi:hypothetical protein